MQLAKVEQRTAVMASTQTKLGTERVPSAPAQIAHPPLAQGSIPKQQKPTNLASMVTSGLKIGAAVMGVMIGAAALTGCASNGGTYQGPSYAELHRTTLTWESPTMNTDGTTFHDENGDGRVDGVKGFIVYRGDGPRSAANDYAESRDITSPDCSNYAGRTRCTYTWNSLSSGTHYFAVKAFKEPTPGARSISDYSNEAAKVIP